MSIIKDFAYKNALFIMATEIQGQFSFILWPRNLHLECSKIQFYQEITNMFPILFSQSDGPLRKRTNGLSVIIRQHYVSEDKL